MITKTVLIPAREQHEGIYAINVTVPWVCPVCGQPRGEPFDAISYDGSLRLHVQGWTNPCGHIDKYSKVREESKFYSELLLTPPATPVTPQPAPDVPGTCGLPDCLHAVCHDLRSKAHHKAFDKTFPPDIEVPPDPTTDEEIAALPIADLDKFTPTPDELSAGYEFYNSQEPGIPTPLGPAPVTPPTEPTPDASGPALTDDIMRHSHFQTVINDDYPRWHAREIGRYLNWKDARDATFKELDRLYPGMWVINSEGETNGFSQYSPRDEYPSRGNYCMALINQCLCETEELEKDINRLTKELAAKQQRLTILKDNQ